MKEAAVFMTVSPKIKNKTKLNEKHFLSDGVFVPLQKIFLALIVYNTGGKALV